VAIFVYAYCKTKNQWYDTIMKRLYIDISLIAHRNLFSILKQINQYNDYSILRHVMLQSIFAQIRKFNAESVYICFDTGKSWRKQYSAFYKAQRKEAREKHSESSGVEWDKFYEILDSLRTELKENFPFYVYGINSLEADDIVAYLVSNSDPEDEKIIVTSDRDYVQLLQYPNTKLYDPIRSKFIKSDNPLHDLQVKIVIGDNSDNIPAIAPRTGIKTAEKMIMSGELDLKLQEKKPDGVTPCELAENYARNERLIDLTKTPKTLIKELEDQIERYKLGSTKNLLKYLVKNNLSQLLDKITQIRKMLENLS
jgi:5'-3' exonuclease